MLKPFVSVVGFKKFCAAIPLKGDLKTKINFPTEFRKNRVAEPHLLVLFRAYIRHSKPKYFMKSGRSRMHLSLYSPIEKLNIQLKYYTC
jgi:hypothetical protein